ncbi:MAG: hypothetical protein ING09_19140 [Roseomonas sp.]|nr:hypothetical protein [Roseomonas sp.]MCA3291155.1 hypothetical protein [Roseomonas sp.]
MTGEAQVLTIRVPLAPRKLPSGRKLVLSPEGNAIEATANVDITLVKALARAFRWRRMIETGRYATVAELAAAEKINPSYVSRVLRLTLLSPTMIEAILAGRQPEGVTLPALLEGVPVGWAWQKSGPLPPPIQTIGGLDGRRTS